MEPNNKRELEIEDIPLEDYGDSLYYDDGEDLSDFVSDRRPLEASFFALCLNKKLRLFNQFEIVNFSQKPFKP